MGGFSHIEFKMSAADEEALRRAERAAGDDPAQGASVAATENETPHISTPQERVPAAGRAPHAGRLPPHFADPTSANLSRSALNGAMVKPTVRVAGAAGRRPLPVQAGLRVARTPAARVASGLPP